MRFLIKPLLLLAFVTNKHLNLSDAHRLEVHKWIEHSRPENTVTTYSRYGKQYMDFAVANNLPLEDPYTLASMMKHGLEDRGLGRSTLTSVLPSAVAHLFRYSDETPTQHPVVREAKKTVMRLTSPSKQKLPVTPAQLVRIAATIKRNKFIHVRDMFMMTLMFLGFLRESEVTQLKPENVWEETIDGEAVLFIFVVKAKNDQFSTGHTIVLGGDATSPICPIKWHRLYRRFAKGKHLFYKANNRARAGLAKTTPNAIIKKLLRTINVDPEPYGSHSLRRGGVTAAVAAGVDILVLARHGNWHSEAIYAYVSQSVFQRLGVSRSILHSPLQGPESKFMY